MTKNVEILPCPFCGSRPKIFGNFETGYRIVCRHTSLTLGESSFSEPTREGTLLAWNHRHAERPAVVLPAINILPTREEVLASLEILARANGADLDEWTGDNVPDGLDDALRAMRRLKK